MTRLRQPDKWQVTIARTNRDGLEQYDALTRAEVEALWFELRDQPDIISIDICQSIVFKNA